MPVASTRVLPEVRAAMNAFMARNEAIRMLELADSSNKKAHQKLTRALADAPEFKSGIVQRSVSDEALGEFIGSLSENLRFSFLSEDPGLDGSSRTPEETRTALVGSLFGSFAVSTNGNIALYKSEAPGNVVVLEQPIKF